MRYHLYFIYLFSCLQEKFPSYSLHGYADDISPSDCALHCGHIVGRRNCRDVLCKNNIYNFIKNSDLLHDFFWLELGVHLICRNLIRY